MDDQRSAERWAVARLALRMIAERLAEDDPRKWSITGARDAIRDARRIARAALADLDGDGDGG